MASKNLLEPYVIAPLPLGVSGASEATRIKSIDLMSYSINAVGTMEGTFDVEGSNDGVTWIPLEVKDVNNLPLTVEGSNKQILINLRMIAFMFMRVSYAADAGDGIATITVAGKGM